jgi:hypothetical protein
MLLMADHFPPFILLVTVNNYSSGVSLCINSSLITINEVWIEQVKKQVHRNSQIQTWLWSVEHLDITKVQNTV